MLLVAKQKYCSDINIGFTYIVYQELLSVMIDKLNGSDNILEFIGKSGKKDLYAELISALRYGSAGYDCFYSPLNFVDCSFTYRKHL